MLDESLLLKSTKRKRAAEGLNLREYISLSLLLTQLTNLRLISPCSLDATASSDPPTPWSPSCSSSQCPASYFDPFPSSPGATAIPAKRRRIPLRLRKYTGPQSASTTSYTPPLTPSLMPCHICYRRPSIHSDLPSYSACGACERQTCYICMRACEGPGCQSEIGTAGSPQQTSNGNNTTTDSRGRSVCGKCCIEVGAEGRVWCLICFNNEHDSEFAREDESDEEEEGGRKRDQRSSKGIGVEKWLECCGDEQWSDG